MLMFFSNEKMDPVTGVPWGSSAAAYANKSTGEKTIYVLFWPSLVRYIRTPPNIQDKQGLQM